MDLTPNSHEDIGAPPAREAYTNAPDLHREMHQILALDAERDGRQAPTVTRPRSTRQPPNGPGCYAGPPSWTAWP